MYLCEMTGAYSQVHGSPVLKALLFKSLRWISATTFAEFIMNFGQNPKLKRLRIFKFPIYIYIYIYIYVAYIIYICYIYYILLLYYYIYYYIYISIYIIIMSGKH